MIRFPSDRFIAEVEARKLHPAYVLVGDETFFLDRCRAALVQHLAPGELRDFGVHEFDLAEVPLAVVLDRARTPSLVAPFQIFFVRGVRVLYGRGSREEDFAAIADYVRNPNPDAVLILVANHVRIAADPRRMELADRDRLERIRDTLGRYCSMVELARVEESEAVRWVMETTASRGINMEADAARELVDVLGADMMLISSELEKLMVYAGGPVSAPAGQAPAERGEKGRLTLAEVETMVLAAKQRSLYELTDALSSKDRARALETLHALLSAGEGEAAAIGHLYMLGRTFRQMLVILERNVRDSRAIWQALWPGFRVPPFAAEDLIRQARRYKSRPDLLHALRLIARADSELRSNPPSKRLVLERLVMDLTSESSFPSVAGFHS